MGIEASDDSESEGERDKRDVDAGESGIELSCCCLRTDCVELASLRTCCAVQDLRR